MLFILLPRSVKIFHYYTNAPLKEITAKLQNSKLDKFVIEIEQESYYPKFKIIKDPKDTSITGKLQIPKQNEINDKPSIHYDVYDFYLDKKTNLAIIQGNQPQSFRILRNALEGIAEMREFERNKDMMIRISDYIKNNSNSIIHDPRFEFAGVKGYKGLSREGFTVTRTRCATSRAGYDERLSKASMFEPIFRIFKIKGIVEEENEKGKLLKINRSFRFSMYVDVSFDEWIAFINHVFLALRDESDAKN